MLEWSVHYLENTTSTGNLFGNYLQYAGLQVIYAKIYVNLKRLYLNIANVIHFIFTLRMFTMHIEIPTTILECLI